MGSKKTTPIRLINAGSMTGTTTVTSNSIDITNLDNIGLQVIWTGTPTGVITVNCSNNNSTFDALTFNPVLTQPAGSAGHYLIDLNQVPFTYLNVSYTNASGSGTLDVWFLGKDIN